MAADWSTFTLADRSIGGWTRGTGTRLAVVVHGGPGLADYTEDLADEVAEGLGDSYRVVRYQQRGLTPSTAEPPFTVAAFVDDLIAVLDHLGAPEAVLVGHSWGGHLALHAATAHPDRVSALVLVDTLGAIGDGGAGTMEAIIGARIGPDALARYQALEAEDAPSGEHGSELMALIWRGYFADPAAAPPPPSMRLDTRVNADVMADVGRLLAEGVLERDLPRLSIPSIHLIGQASPIDPEAMRATAALMRGATVIELVDTGHFTWIERPGSVAAAIRSLDEPRD